MMAQRWGLVALAAALITGASLAQTSTGRSVLLKAGLLNAPVAYTTLAFTYPQSLPSQLGTGRAAIFISFEISNVSDSSRSYRWTISLVQNQQRRIAATGLAFAPSRRRATIGRTVTTSCAGSRIRVEVRLASPAESIGFWATCAASGSNRT